MKHSVAESFDGDVILIIHNKTGAYIHPISDYNREFEIMTLGGTKYKVIKPPTYVKDKYYVELEEIIKLLLAAMTSFRVIGFVVM